MMTNKHHRTLMATCVFLFVGLCVHSLALFFCPSLSVSVCLHVFLPYSFSSLLCGFRNRIWERFRKIPNINFPGSHKRRRWALNIVQKQNEKNASKNGVQKSLKGGYGPQPFLTLSLFHFLKICTSVDRSCRNCSAVIASTQNALTIG